MEVEGNDRKPLKLPDWLVAKTAAPAELAPQGLFLSDQGMNTPIRENWCQNHLADGELYPFWKKSMRIWPK